MLSEKLWNIYLGVSKGRHYKIKVGRSYGGEVVFLVDFRKHEMSKLISLAAVNLYVDMN